MRRKGFTLIATIFILLVFAVLAIGFSALFFSESRVTVEETRYNRAFYIADAGKNYALKIISQYPTWNQPMGFPITKSFGGGYFRVYTVGEAFSSITIISTGIVTIEGKSYQRSVGFSVANVEGGLFGGHSVFTYGQGTTTDIGSNVLIEGNLFISGDIVVGTGTTISGEVSATGSIDVGSGSEITGSAEAYAATPEAIPLFDSSYYDNKLAVAAQQPAGDVVWGNNSVETLEGTTYVNGDLYLQNNATIDIIGSAEVIVTGKVTVTNTVSIGDNFTLIAGGLIDINNGISIGGNGLWYSSTTISVNNSPNIGEVGVGEGTTFISPGNIDFRNNVAFHGFIYSGANFSIGNNTELEGIIAANSISVVGTNSHIVYNPYIVDLNSMFGLSDLVWEGRLEVISWHEIY